MKFQLLNPFSIRKCLQLTYQQSTIINENKQINLKNIFSAKKESLVNGKKYDVAVIGGGSGGIACSKQAAKLGLSTILFDFVTPSTQNTVWGLGGTCVNVGCIPKKLFHFASEYKSHLHRLSQFGIVKEVAQNEFHWELLVSNIQQYIKSLNFGYAKQLKSENVTYVNAMAHFQNQNTLSFQEQNIEKLSSIEAKNIVIAVGNRPNFLTESECKNAIKYSITSDDLFSLKKFPKKILIVGGGYVAVECAGFLAAFGSKVTLVTRNKFLKEFDQEIVSHLLCDLEKRFGVSIHGGVLPKELNLKEFDQVLMAIGRQPQVMRLGLDKAQVRFHPNSHKILSNELRMFQTHVDHIFAIGDCLQNGPELTPVAITLGRQVAKFIARQLNKTAETIDDKQKYRLPYVPTTIFTPQEYSSCGLSEQEAIAKYKDENIEVYHSKFMDLRDFNQAQEKAQKVFCKIIVQKNCGEKVIGIHYLGPDAGEVMQGLSFAMNLGLTKPQLDSYIGIHPTIAEEFVNMHITKRSDKSPGNYQSFTELLADLEQTWNLYMQILPKMMGLIQNYSINRK